jgi:hypothetical protein
MRDRESASSVSVERTSVEGAISASVFIPNHDSLLLT